MIEFLHCDLFKFKDEDNAPSLSDSDLVDTLPFAKDELRILVIGTLSS